MTVPEYATPYDIDGTIEAAFTMGKRAEHQAALDATAGLRAIVQELEAYGDECPCEMDNCSIKTPSKALTDYDQWANPKPVNSATDYAAHKRKGT